MKHMNVRAGITLGSLGSVAALFVFGMAGCGVEPSGKEGGVGTTQQTSPTGNAQPIRLAAMAGDAEVSGSDAAAVPVPAPTIWNFTDGTAPGPELLDSPTLGWQAAEGVEGLNVVDGKLTGTITADIPMLYVSLPADAVVKDALHGVDIRMRASGSGTVEFSVMSSVQPIVAMAQNGVWSMSSPLVAGDEMRTYRMQDTFKFSAPGFSSSNVRQIFMRFTKAKGVRFEIESVRFIYQNEYLASRTSGRSWEGLADIFRDSIVARAPESFTWTVDVPAGAWLDVGVGTIEAQPLRFVVSVEGEEEPVWARTVTTPERWEDGSADLSAFAGRTVRLTCALESEKAGTLGYWGSPVIRTRCDGERPGGVILIIADTLRRDHLNMYGYKRETAPTLAGMAKEGVLFTDCISPATWTKVATPSIMTGLWPTSHTVKEFTDRLPSSATTLAEVFQAAGYATMAMSSVPFTGRFSNMHQGFEQLHESSSITEPNPSKSAREYVDRLLPWLDEHRDVPFFAVLHVFDPHDPFEPRAPFNTWWADPAKREEHEKQDQAVRKVITDPLLRIFGMPTEAELRKAKVDPEEFISYWKDWYDGAIRGFDTEVERLLEGLREIGLYDDTVIAVISDHGEEFLDHGATFHGQSVYGDLCNVMLMLWQPTVLPQGMRVGETVSSVDLMPTLLALRGLEPPGAIQGQSLVPLLSAGGEGAALHPAVTEKAAIVNTGGPANREVESYGIILDNWKLVHNTIRHAGMPEFELYNHASDPLDLNNVAEDHPEIVAKLTGVMETWRESALAAKLAPDTETASGASADELEQLRSLGYLE